MYLRNRRQCAQILMIGAAGFLAFTVLFLFGVRYVWPEQASPFELESASIGWGARVHQTQPLDANHEALKYRRSTDSFAILSKHGWSVSVGAYRGLPSNILDRDLHRLADAVNHAGGRFDVMRDNYSLINQPGPQAKWRSASGESVAGPDGLVPWRYVGDGPVPIKLVPDPDTLRREFRWDDSETNPVDLTSPFSELSAKSGFVGRSLLFKPGLNSHLDFIVAPPQPAVGQINSRGFQTRSLGHANRAVVGGSGESHFERIERSLRAGVPGGGQLAARVKTVGVNESVYLVQIEPGDGVNGAYRFLAFPFADAWPVNHAWQTLTSREGPAQVKLSGNLTGPSEGNRSLMVVPCPTPLVSLSGMQINDESVIDPLPFPSMFPLWGNPSDNQERLIIPEMFARTNPVVTISKGEGWQPFAESYNIHAGLSAATVLRRDLRLIIVFGCAEKEDLDCLVRFLHNTPKDQDRQAD
jgi:hypothetical protein